MIDWFTDQGWTIERRTITGDHEVWATTGDGWQIQYAAQENGDNPLDRLQRTLLDQRRAQAPASRGRTLSGRLP